MKNIILLFFLLCGSLIGGSCYAFREESNEPLHWLHLLEQHYLAGNWTEIEIILNNNTPVNNVEKTGHYLYRAKIAVEQKEISGYLEEAVRLSSDIMYGQRALVKLANIAQLERNYQKSLSYLLRVKTQMISDRDYLLSSVYLKLENYPEAIGAAQDFIKITKDTVKRELSYLQIVEAFILNKQYQQALSTLETMVSRNYVVNHHSIVDFKEGYCLEQMGKIAEAIEKYKYVITQYPYSEFAFRAERRLYDLTIETAEKVDYASLSVIGSQPERLDRTSVATSADIPTGTGDNFYVQVNAFAEQVNAASHSQYLRNLGYDNIIFSKTVLDQKLYVVAIGPFPVRKDASAKQVEIKNKLNMDSFIIKY